MPWVWASASPAVISVRIERIRANGSGPSCAEQLVQPAAFEILHGDEEAAVEPAQVVDPHHVGVADFAADLDLAQQPRIVPEAFLARHQEHLDRHGLAEIEVPGFADARHATPAQLVEDLVAAREPRAHLQETSGVHHGLRTVLAPGGPWRSALLQPLGPLASVAMAGTARFQPLVAGPRGLDLAQTFEAAAQPVLALGGERRRQPRAIDPGDVAQALQGLLEETLLDQQRRQQQRALGKPGIIRLHLHQDGSGAVLVSLGETGAGRLHRLASPHGDAGSRGDGGRRRRGRRQPLDLRGFGGHVRRLEAPGSVLQPAGLPVALGRAPGLLGGLPAVGGAAPVLGRFVGLGGLAGQSETGQEVARLRRPSRPQIDLRHQPVPVGDLGGHPGGLVNPAHFQVMLECVLVALAALQELRPAQARRQRAQQRDGRIAAPHLQQEVRPLDVQPLHAARIDLPQAFFLVQAPDAFLDRLQRFPQLAGLLVTSGGLLPGLPLLEIAGGAHGLPEGESRLPGPEIVLRGLEEKDGLVVATLPGEEIGRSAGVEPAALRERAEGRQEGVLDHLLLLPQLGRKLRGPPPLLGADERLERLQTVPLAQRAIRHM